MLFCVWIVLSQKSKPSLFLSFSVLKKTVRSHTFFPALCDNQNSNSIKEARIFSALNQFDSASQALFFFWHRWTARNEKFILLEEKYLRKVQNKATLPESFTPSTESLSHISKKTNAQYFYPNVLYSYVLCPTNQHVAGLQKVHDIQRGPWVCACTCYRHVSHVNPL